MDGKRLTFGFQGIYQGTAVLYDRETGSFWMHLTGECFHGPLAGKRLARLPTGRHTTWIDWTTGHPGTRIMRPARATPEGGGPRYFPPDAAKSGLDFFPPEFPATIHDRDPRLPPATLVYGITVNGAARAYPFARLLTAPLVEEEVGGEPVTVWFSPRSRSAAAFSRRLGDRVLSFEPAGDDRYQDRATGTLYDMEGRAVEGPGKGAALTPLFSLMAEWYGWYAVHPDTTVFEP